ncbi:hypothetical protein Tco_0060815, partial [Tanacetum coccineum]
FLEKPTESEGFEEIVDFLNANPIKYTLTVNPPIYCSCIKQFWDTVKAKTVKGEVQLQTLVDKKKKVLDLEKAKTAQDSEITSLKKKVKKLKRRNTSRTPGIKRLRKIGSARWVESSNEASLDEQEVELKASDEEIEGPMKDQPISADASPTALSPGYIADSDPEEDKEDPKEDPADHPADG